MDDTIRLLHAWKKSKPKSELTLDISWEGVSIPPLPTASLAAIASSQTPAEGQQSQQTGTATARQLRSLPEVLAMERAAGNTAPDIADFWLCKNRGCRQFDCFTCWVKDYIPQANEGRDLAHNHYPADGNILAKWSRDIAAGKATIESPSANVVADLISAREVKKKGKKAQSNSNEGDTSKWRDLAYLQASQNVKASQQIPYPVNIVLPSEFQLIRSTDAAINRDIVHSSPIATDSPDDELLEEFFTWLIPQPRFESRREDLIRIKDRLIEDEWSLQSLEQPRRGGLTMAEWENYGWKPGFSHKIRERISQFKRWQAGTLKDGRNQVDSGSDK